MTDKQCLECKVKNCAYKILKKTNPHECSSYLTPLNIEWIKEQSTKAQEIVEFLCKPCSNEVMDNWCDTFNSNCIECKTAWLNCRREKNI